MQGVAKDLAGAIPNAKEMVIVGGVGHMVPAWMIAEELKAA